MKFGIYCHWGPQTVQHASGDEEMTTMQALEEWTGEEFNANVWVNLFEAAGAQFAGPVAWHGSGMLNWDSKITDWNTLNKGPKIDIVGELVREVRKRNMKVLVSLHNNYSIWGPVSKSDSTYLDPLKEESPLYTTNEGRRDERLFQGWYDRTTEVVDKYRPDIAFSTPHVRSEVR